MTSISDLRDHPARLAFAAAFAVLVLVWTNGIQAHAFADTNSPEFYALGDRLRTLQALVLAAIPLVALRWPVVAGGIGLTPLLLELFAETGLPITAYAALVLGGTVAWQHSRRAGGALGALAVALVAPVILVPWSELAVYSSITVDFTFDRDRPLMFAAYAVAAALALALAEAARRSGERMTRAAALEARAEEVERTSAVTEERARLARDLHDVVAHHVSLIAVRAETAPYTETDLGEGGKQVLTEIAADSRRALDELRGVLGVLRRSETDPALAPQPTAADLPDLVARAVDAGEPVRWTSEPAGLDTVPAAQGYAGYRVLQEALTTARRHAPGAGVDVTATGTDAGLTLRVVTHVPGAVDRPGRGLTGARERVEALGGTFRAGPVGDTFTVAVLLGG